MMADVFISHAAIDQPLAAFLHRHLSAEGVSVYLASLANKPGELWMPAIMSNLQASQWVICLASRAACASPWVMQEMGAAIGTRKKLVPVVWDQSPAELPAWMRQYQAVELGRDNRTARAAIAKIAESIKADKQRGLLILGMLVAGIAIFGR
jgi:TIR domain